jgi:hypothetical protein
MVMVRDSAATCSGLVIWSVWLVRLNVSPRFHQQYGYASTIALTRLDRAEVLECSFCLCCE